MEIGKLNSVMEIGRILFCSFRVLVPDQTHAHKDESSDFMAWPDSTALILDPALHSDLNERRTHTKSNEVKYEDFSVLKTR